MAALDARAIESLIVRAGLGDDAGPLGVGRHRARCLSKHVVSPAADVIRAAIDVAGGAIPFSEFQRLALYGPAGFYTRAGGGRRPPRCGAFLTSPEVGPLFGAVLGRYLDAQWRRLGRPAPFTVVDAGAGPGTLAHDPRRPTGVPGGDALRRRRAVCGTTGVAPPAGVESAVTSPTARSTA